VRWLRETPFVDKEKQTVLVNRECAGFFNRGLIRLNRFYHSGARVASIILLLYPQPIFGVPAKRGETNSRAGQSAAMLEC
jgi:hypothetical protein